MRVLVKEPVHVDVSQLAPSAAPRRVRLVRDGLVLEATADQTALVAEMERHPEYTKIVATHDGDGDEWTASVTRSLDGSLVYVSHGGERFVVRVERAAGSSPSTARAVVGAARLRDCYCPAYRFPAWAIAAVEVGAEALALRSSVEVLYHRGDPLDTVERLTRQREPVNIGRGTSAVDVEYDAKRFRELTGVERAYYGEHFGAHGTLAPNIAVVCTTLFAPKAEDVLTSEPFRVHVINLIGCAFDSTEQPDYEAIILPARRDPAKKTEALVRKAIVADLVARYTRLWSLALAALRRRKLRRLAYAGVGASSFITQIADICRDEPEFHRLVQEPAMKAVFESAPDIELVRMGLIPAFIVDDRANAARTLYVNAWDPFSMVGNGNGGDMSLDGFWGRHTCMAPQCTPLVNAEIAYVAV